MKTTWETLEVTLARSGVLTVALNRPDVRNCFNVKMIEELTQLFTDVGTASKVKAVVFKGNGPVFCAGGDLNWMKASVGLTLDENLEDTRRLSRMFLTINECPKVVIGAVHGAAIGGGVGMVSVCDIVVATEGTQFSLSEVRLGIVPACIGPFVIQKIGTSHARRLFLSAERFGGELAHGVGLVHELVSTEEEMQKRVDKLLENIVQCSPNALKVAKSLVQDLSFMGLSPERKIEPGACIEYVSRVLSEIRVSQEGQEGVKAFLEKRKPSWLTS